MGESKNIDHERFPKQGSHLGKRVRLCFNYDTSKTIDGVCVRDDMEEPGRTIFKGDNNRYYEAAECQYHPLD